MRQSIKWHIGSSGFHYKEWKDIFYEGIPASKWVSFYACRFNTLESNVSFYRFPSLSMLQKWYNDSPAGFSISVKAPRSITHYKKFKECESLLRDFYQVIKEGLKDKLGCVLFQLPPSFSYTEERLHEICTQLSPSFNNVLEFRHVSWWTEAVYKALKDHTICFCGISHPTLPEKVICTSPVLYYRFHGVPDLYRSAYSKAFLDKIFDEIQNCGNVKHAFLYFNNTMTSAAIEHMQYLETKIKNAD
jgi:uncharacterized protein YecE (DUF72 family)